MRGELNHLQPKRAESNGASEDKRRRGDLLGLPLGQMAAGEGLRGVSGEFRLQGGTGVNK